MRVLIFAILSVLLVGCSVKESPTEPKKEPKTITAPTTKPVVEEKPKEKPKTPPLVKSATKPSLVASVKPSREFYKALGLSIGYYEALNGSNKSFNFYDKSYSAKEMADSLRLFEKISKLSEGEFLEALDKNFDLYESKNTSDLALFTGYYAPLLKGSFTKTDKFNAPLYPLPRDIISVDLKKFPTANSARSISGKLNGKTLEPYYTRAQIEKGALKERPLLYLNNKVDAFLLEVQGSGIIEIDGKKHYVGYAGKNGRPYTSIGKVINDEKLIDSDKLNMQTIKEFLDADEAMRDYILNKNESYVFFKLNKQAGVFGNISLPLTAKESVAMDSELMPRGALAYIKTVIPKKVNGLKVVSRSEREPFEKFVMVQDTGGAIRGGGRVDIYFGEGEEGLFYAGQTASKGEVYLLVAKKESLR